jgi:hypothetical protein
VPRAGEDGERARENGDRAREDSDRAREKISRVIRAGSPRHSVIAAAVFDVSRETRTAWFAPRMCRAALARSPFAERATRTPPHVRVRVCVHVRVHAHVHVYVHVRLHVHVHVHAHAHDSDSDSDSDNDNDPMFHVKHGCQERKWARNRPHRRSERGSGRLQRLPVALNSAVPAA